MEENPIQPPVQAPTQPPAPTKPNLKFPLILLVVVGLAIAGYFASAYYFQLYPFEQVSVAIPTFTPRPSLSPSPTPTSTSVPITTQPAIDTSTWKIYRNDVYNFEIKYPQDWQLLAEIQSINRISFGQKKNIGGQGYDGDWFVFVYNSSDKSSEEIIRSMGKQFSDRQEIRENIIVGGLSAMKVTVTTPTYPDWSYESVIIEQNNKIYWIHNGAIKNVLFGGFYGSFKLI